MSYGHSHRGAKCQNEHTHRTIFSPFLSVLEACKLAGLDQTELTGAILARTIVKKKENKSLHLLHSWKSKERLHVRTRKALGGGRPLLTYCDLHLNTHAHQTSWCGDQMAVMWLGQEVTFQNCWYYLDTWGGSSWFQKGFGHISWWK